MTSRLIVKNLPKNITETKLKEIFEEKGSITDIQLKYTKDGVFRQFAFIGYENEEDANAALKYFNNIFIQTAKIKVEPCAALGSEQKPKSWSKHAVDSNTYRKLHGIDELERAEKKKQQSEVNTKKKNKIDEIVGEYKDDPEFQEFMKVHDKNRNLWQNDDDIFKEIDSKVRVESKGKKGNNNDSGLLKENNISENENYENNKSWKEDPNLSSTNESENEESEERNQSKLALQNEVSDLDYMKSLMKKDHVTKTEKKQSLKESKKSVDLFTIKIRNIPLAIKKKDILKFFQPLKPFSVRIPINSRGFCYVGFKQEKDFKKAMLKDKSFIKGKQVYFVNFTERNKITKDKKEQCSSNKVLDTTGKWAKQEGNLENEEDISESGKIFFRNLSYTISEDDIQNLFSKYGPIAEISLPIDPITRKIKGFGTVTYVMPEHAVLAFNELDGTTFHGRLLHLIPGKANDNMEDHENTENLSFKEKKALKLKKSAGQNHNWNILFMGSNAVADILAKQFETTKETILDANTGGSSAAVRLALGETQIVLEMKKFLEDNSVQLDAFETTNKKRSKTVILAKNLPAGTTTDELNPLFSKFGLIGRIVLPPSGVTAIIEYLDPSEAKKAFYKLAYSKFKHLPLYLEWAPENTFKDSKGNEKLIQEVENKKKSENGDENENQEKEELQSSVLEKENIENVSEVIEDDNDNDEPEPGTTLFLRNLNFGTREDTVKNHFKHLGPIHLAQVAMRKDPKNPKNITSLGYGFIQFKKRSTAELALKEMQFTNIEGNRVELKRSDRTLKIDPKAAKKKAQKLEQTGSKILIRNIPFQAKTKEIFEIFKAFGELRSVRLPKKTTPGEQSLRGFGFVDYLSKSDAKKAFETLSGSTHLYGRRLVLEWAKNDENDVTELRKRTAESFKDGTSKKLKNSNKAVFDTSNIDEVFNENDEMS
ncbi:probable RNA-binding protein 19 [Condylostylus longicornis]|uniref:probable RNA-binding protein 19 n=1 Tax=Condylostylus longicornis TaxID=2530218 RepID=UPI00244DA2BF|nr:probable RNA-binding protein 19 [Condylostylus longicornis]